MLKLKIAEKYAICSATIKLYRGTKDIYVADLDHCHIKKDGIWGPGTYFSRDKSVADWYAFKNYDSFGVCTEYSASGLKILKLTSDKDYIPPQPTEDNLKLLPPGQKKLGSKKATIKQNSVTKLAKALHYDAVEIDDRQAHFAEPMVIVFGRCLTPVRFYYNHIFHDIGTQEAPASQAKEVDKWLHQAEKAWRKELRKK